MDNSLDLFKQLSRSERQELGRQLWIKHKCCGSLVYPTGVGKTRTALNCIECVLKKYPTFRVLIVVPTEILYDQWNLELDKRGLSLNCEVQIVNTVAKHKYKATILVIDEIHRTGSLEFSKIFDNVDYKYILGLTATFERLDGKEKLIQKYCPVIDTITTEEALFNGWISKYVEYEVIINVPDIDIYKGYNKIFTENYEYFNFDFNLAMSMVGPKGYINRLKLRDEKCPNGSKSERSAVLKDITYHAVEFMRIIQKRKAFINDHPKKLEIVNKIIEARKNKKIITFSNNVKMAESIDYGEVYTGKTSKKKGRTTIEEFNEKDTGVLNTVKKADEGLDIKGLSVAIILGLDSSKIKATQRRGRAIRFEPDKTAEIFNIIINNTVELEWFKKSHENEKYIQIDEKNLEKILNYEDYTSYKKPLLQFSFRY
jgi:superfamily II DNA or RNA helicase